MSDAPRPFFDDAHLLAFDKPSGLAVQGGSGLSESLESIVAARYAKSKNRAPRLVHRLDRETSGVIVLARTKPAAAFLSAAFAERRVVKTYHAIVCGGAPAPAEGDIEAPLVKTVRERVEIVRVGQSGEAGAQAARTRYRTLAAVEGAALLALSPETGRMHQLRVHLAAIGRPIAGDAKYGGLFVVSGVRVTRLMLHASRLDLPHPDGRRLRLTAPAPSAFVELWRALGGPLSALPEVAAEATFGP